jgi:hypothetical protein
MGRAHRRKFRTRPSEEAPPYAPLVGADRLLDLVRYCRHQLHEEKLITDDEFAQLVNVGSASARRLEAYDALIEETRKLRLLRVAAEQVLVYIHAPKNDHNQLCLATALETMRAAIGGS